jgi:hypothetical protein
MAGASTGHFVGTSEYRENYERMLAVEFSTF